MTRLLLGPRMRVQAPPNLSDLAEVVLLLRAGVDDWGGVSPLTPDHVNPERPWPHLDDLARLTAEAGFVLRERLTAHPEYVLRADPWIDPRVRAHVTALAGPDGLAVEGRCPVGLPWQQPDEYGDGYAAFAAASAGGRTDLHETVDTTGRTGDRRSDFDEVYGDWSAIGEHATTSRPVLPPAARRTSGSTATSAPPSRSLRTTRRRSRAPTTPALALALMSMRRRRSRRRCAGIADDVRRDTVGDEVTYVVNRNINFTNVCYTGCRFCAFAQRRTDADAFTLSLPEVGDRVAEAWDVGATEICMQGGIHPDLPGTAYFDLAREVKRRAPGHPPARVLPDGGRQRRDPVRDVDPGMASSPLRKPASTRSRAPPPRSSTTTSAGC